MTYSAVRPVCPQESRLGDYHENNVDNEQVAGATASRYDAARERGEETRVTSQAQGVWHLGRSRRRERLGSVFEETESQDGAWRRV